MVRIPNAVFLIKNYVNLTKFEVGSAVLLYEADSKTVNLGHCMRFQVIRLVRRGSDIIEV